MLLNATLPKIFQRKVLRWLPPELGQYLLEAGKGFSFSGDIALVCCMPGDRLVPTAYTTEYQSLIAQSQVLDTSMLPPIIPRKDTIHPHT